MTEPPDTSPEPFVDAWTARMTRASLGHVPLDVLCLVDADQNDEIDTASVVETVRRRGRLGKVIAVRRADFSGSWGEALTAAIRQVEAPIFVVSDWRAEWNRDILDRLLKSIEFSDLALGARPCRSFFRKALRTIAAFARGVFWGAGVLDPHTPYRIARSEPFKKFPLQSATRFADVELIAKANFLDGLIHEETLPVASFWEPASIGRGQTADVRRLFRTPRFRFDMPEDAAIESSSIGHTEMNPIRTLDPVAPAPHADVRTPDIGD